jgi:hypothetical protein
MATMKVMNNLGGWQRAWVVTVVIWGVLVMVGSSLDSPETPEQLRKEQSALLTNYKEYPIGDPRKNEEVVVNGQHLKRSGEFHLSDSDMTRLNDLTDRIKSYPHDLTSHIVNSAAVWAFPLIVVYLFGLSIAWVRAGFRQ